MDACIGAKRVSFSSERSEEISLSILDRCKKQDYEAFSHFVDQFDARVYGYVRRMICDAEEAQDVTQEVFIRAYQAFPKYDARASVKSWIFRIAHNLCIDRLRSQRRAPETLTLGYTSDEEEDRDVADNSLRPDAIAMNVELAQAVEDAMSQMSDKLRSVLLLHDREDASYEEIASMLSLPVGTVKSRLFLAREFLQKKLSSYLFETSCD